MPALADSFDKIADPDMWVDLIVVFFAFLLPTLLANTIDPRMDLPDEVYGLMVIVGSEVASGSGYKRQLRIGGGLYVVDKVAERFDIKQRVTG